MKALELDFDMEKMALPKRFDKAEGTLKEQLAETTRHTKARAADTEAAHDAHGAGASSGSGGVGA